MYINYYKHTTPQPSQAELEREYERNKGVIRTIVIPEENYYVNERKRNRYINAISSCYNRIRSATNLTAFERANLYQTFRIRKRNGGTRTIEAPLDAVKEQQAALLKTLTKGLHILPHDAAHGGVRNRNCKTALERHKDNNSKWFLKMDFSDAFGSITKPNLKEALDKSVLKGLYQWSITDLLSCVYGNNPTQNDGLPQGSPLSPFLLNMYMIEFDYKITEFCNANNLVYTRYVDDIIISGYEKFDKAAVINAVLTNIPAGMSINNAKTRFGSVNWKNWNLGLMYNNEGNLTVGYRAKKHMKNMVHNYNRNENKDRTEYMQLNGLLTYYKYIEPEYFSSPKFNLEQPNGDYLIPQLI